MGMNIAYRMVFVYSNNINCWYAMSIAGKGRHLFCVTDEDEALKKLGDA